MKDLDFFEVFLRFLRSTNDCLSEQFTSLFKGGSDFVKSFL